jgi:hypothetical protein
MNILNGSQADNLAEAMLLAVPVAGETDLSLDVVTIFDSVINVAKLEAQPKEPSAPPFMAGTAAVPGGMAPPGPERNK